MKTKNILSKILFVVILGLFLVMMAQVQVYGQTDSAATTTTQTVQPVNADGDFAEYFVSIGGLAALTLLVTQWLKKIAESVFKITIEKIVAGYASWVIALLLSAIGFWLQIGIFLGVTWYYIIVYGVVAGLIANGIFSIEHVKILFQVLKLIPKKQTTAEVKTKF